MTITSSRQRLSADAEKLAHAEFLLEKYPETTDEEVAQIAHFLNNASPMDVGLLSANADAWRKVEAIRRDHPTLFRAPRTSWIIGVALVLATILTVVLLWDSGLRH